MSHIADRNLLFGILALQMDFITRDQLVGGMNAWVLDKTKSLGQILIEQGTLDADNRAWLDAGVERHLAKHHNDPQESLAALGSVSSARKDLQQLDDADVQASLAVVGHARPDEDQFFTRPYKSSDTDSKLRFRILRPHAEGGLGRVSVARDEELSREVALKEIKELYAQDEESRTRFLREAEITGGLEHPGIVPVYSLGSYADGRPFYAMRFIRGQSLWEAIKEFHNVALPLRDRKAHGNASASDQLSSRGAHGLQFRQLLGRFVDVCQAIQYAHDRGVLHRDLKPGNIMLGKYGETLVVDWGLAKARGVVERTPGTSELPVHAHPESDSATQPGKALGTPAFMSPEQAAGQLDRLGPSSDVYSLGATLYCLLTGRPPIEHAETGEMLRRAQRGEFRRPRQINPQIDAALEAICLKAMAQQQADRYVGAKELAEDVEHWLADEPVIAWPEPMTVKARRFIARHRVLAASAAAVLVVSAGLLLAGNLLLSQANTSLENANKDTLAARALETKALRASEANERTAQDRLVQIHLAESARLVEEGDVLKALGSLTFAMQEERGGEDAGHIHRMRLAAHSRQCPRLVGWWEHEEVLSDRIDARTKDGQRILTVGKNRAVLRDIGTGKPMLPPLEHSGLITGVISPDGSRLATLAFDETIRLWDGKTGALICPAFVLYKSDKGGFNSPDRPIMFSADNRTLVGTTFSATQFWEAATGRPIEPMVKHEEYTTCQFSPDGKRMLTISISKIAGTRLWDLPPGGADPRSLQSKYASWTFSPDGKRLVSFGQSMQWWDVPTAQPLGPTQPQVFDGAFSHDGRRLATLSPNKTVQLWDAGNGQKIGTPFPVDIAKLVYSFQGSNLVFSPDGTRLALQRHSDKTTIWDADTGKPLFPPIQLPARVEHVRFSPDGRHFLTYLHDYFSFKEWRVWDTATGKPVTPPFRNKDWIDVSFGPESRYLFAMSRRGVQQWDLFGGVSSMEITHDKVDHVAFAPDGRQFLSIGNNRVAFWDAESGKPASLILKTDSVRNATYSPDGSVIVTTHSNKKVQLWDAKTGQAVSQPMPHPHVLHRTAFSPDAHSFATISGDRFAGFYASGGGGGGGFGGGPTGTNLVQIWNGTTGHPIGKPLQHIASVNAAVFTKDGQQLVTTSAKEGVQVWHVPTGRKVAQPIVETKQPLLFPEFSPDGNYVLSNDPQGQTQIWSVVTGKPVSPILKYVGGLKGATFSRDSQHVVTFSELEARVWLVADGKAVGQPLRHRRRVSDADIHPHGKLLAIACDDATVRVWDMATNQPITPPLMHPGPVSMVRFSPNGQRLATISNGQARIWDLGITKDRPFAYWQSLSDVLAGQPVDVEATASKDAPRLIDTWNRLLRDHPNEFAPLTAEHLAAWHDREAAHCEATAQWFAAVFHLDRLVEFQGNTPDILARRQRAHDKLSP